MKSGAGRKGEQVPEAKDCFGMYVGLVEGIKWRCESKLTVVCCHDYVGLAKRTRCLRRAGYASDSACH